MQKNLFFTFLLIFFFPSPAVAWENTAEHTTTDFTDQWLLYEYDPGYNSADTTLYSNISLSQTADPRGYPLNTVLSLTNDVWKKDDFQHTVYGWAGTKENISISYISFIIAGDQITGTGSGDTANLFYLNITKADQSPLATFNSIQSSQINANSKYEIIQSGNYFELYLNGSKIQTVSSNDPSYSGLGKIWFCSARYAGPIGEYILYIDDISTASTIGVPETFAESTDTFSATWTAQLMRSYTAQYQISLYSLSNTANAGKIQSWNIPQNDTTDTLEHGYLNISRNNTLNTNFGLYMLEMTRGEEILADQYFYYYQLSNSVGYPELLFLGESDVLTEIRDEDYNGGEIEGGGSVYLFPDIQDDGTYTFTYEILETPYSLKTELTTVYNNTALNGTTINYSGLSTQNYKVSADGAEVGITNGADTYSYTFTDWSTETNHIISFAPDYTLAGVWGEVKNSETQEGIKSATVSVSGANFSKTLYTDDNGLFYLTKGIEAGKTYTISVSKTGYSTPPSQTAITVEGSTTRQDFYIDKLSTSGSGLYYAPHDVGFTVLEYWYSGAGLTGVNYAIYNGTESLKTGTTDSKGMFTGSDLSGGTNYTIILTHNGTTYTEYVEPSLSEYTFVLNKEGILHQYANSWLTLSYTENTNNVTITYESNKTLTGASLTAIAGNGTTVYTQTLSTTTGSFTFETGGEGDYTLNFHIEATDGSTASQSWGLSYPDKIPLFPDSYPAWLKNILFSGIVMVFLLAFGKSKNDIACGAVAILTSMGYIFEWFTGSFYFVVLVWIIALGAVFLHYKRTGGIG